jgi:2-oxoisovalerate dehydrogenase E1 component alpha subunit
MMLMRTFDERVLALNRQGKVPIAASSQGHEAAELGSLLAAKKCGNYMLFPYYRDLALRTAGIGVNTSMLSYMGKAGDVYSGGRQFPLQGACLEDRVICQSNVVAAGMTQAVGYALASRMQGDDTVVLSYFGDGASSQGECHEAMNFASIHKLPVVFICENNKYAISVPLHLQMAISNVAERAKTYGFPGHVVDGIDFLDCYGATKDAISHARTVGPVLLDMDVERIQPHTTDDDQRRYRSKEELDMSHKRDPVVILRDYLTNVHLLDDTRVEEIRVSVRAEVNEATDLGEASPYPDTSTFYDHLYAP